MRLDGLLSLPWLGACVAIACPVLVWRMLRNRARLHQALRERAAETERSRLERARVAVEDERERIAAELEDVVAHALGAMTVQASAARRLVEPDPERAGRAFDAIEASGREALQEIRRLIGVLRHDDSELALAPQPGLRDVRRRRPPERASADRRRGVRRRRLKPWTIDVAIGLTACAASVLEIAFSDRREGPLAANLAVATGYSLPLLLRRRAPLRVAVVTLASVAVGSRFLTPANHLDMPLIDMILLGYAVGAFTCGRATWLGAAVLLVGMLVNVALLTGAGPVDFIFPTAFVLLAALAGGTVRSRAELTEQLHEAAARAEEVHREQLRAAAGEQRRRIVRETHDAIARSMSAMVVRAGGARQILARDPAGAAAAAEQIERTGTEAMAAMRHLLGLVHPDERRMALVRQPSLAQLDALVARARAVGLPATLYVEGPRRPLPAGLELAAYRIAQAALTNAIQHAGAAPTSVTLRWRRDELELEVRDAGPGGRAAAIERDGGHGLVGMRERVRLYGGELDTAQPAHGGWIVRARLPLPSDREAAPAAPHASGVAVPGAS